MIGHGDRCAESARRAALFCKGWRWLRQGQLHRLCGSLLLTFALVATCSAQQAPPAASKSAAAEPSAQDSLQAEARVVNYIRDHLQPGQPLLVTELYNQVFTQPSERQALDKLYRAFFRIPLFVAQYQSRFGRPPTLKTIAEQFDLRAPGAADVLLRVMESDPRVPRFLSRDPKTGEITKVDIALIQSDPRFGQALAHQLTGWEGKRAAALSLERLDGSPIQISNPGGKALLLYVWFTGCPPCIQETPALVDLNHRFESKGLLLIGANADKLLGLDYTDAVRRRYIAEHKIDFPVAHWDKSADAAYGGISIFPTLFLMDSGGVIRRHWVGFASANELQDAVEKLVSGN